MLFYQYVYDFSSLFRIIINTKTYILIYTTNTLKHSLLEKMALAQLL